MCYSQNASYHLNQQYLLYSQNLYGFAMSEKIPVDGFQWIDSATLQTWTQEILAAMDASGDKGYILMVDLEIPATIHDQTSDYPLCPEQLEITENMISPQCR